MKSFKTTLLAFLALLLALAPATAEGLTGGSAPLALPELTLAPAVTIPPAELEDDGRIRVYLKSLNDPESLHLTLQGAYALEGDGDFRFDRGAALVLTSVDGEIWLAAGGLKINMGPALTLTRHAAAEGQTNGIRIAETERENLYCGDLSVSVKPNGGLKSVLALPVEEYLSGVVAYEMSDSFPIEALKAQAVAARTYAMQRKWSAGRRDYDLVDTTADQVFRGWSPDFENVIDAINATRGLVGLYRGGFATCYYTASNGGQTALASQIWGSADADGYLAMTDDPYDLENPHSLESEVTFTAKCEGSLKLKGMLEDALSEKMREEGFDDCALDAITGIEPVNPRFEGSRLYDGLAFDLRVKVPESALATPTPVPDPTPTPDPAQAPAATAAQPTAAMPTAAAPEKWAVLPEIRRVTIPVFDDIKDGLSLGLNGADCELISVETRRDGAGVAESFRLVMRFGHGVGMSQRGAQWMAGEYGRDFMQILAFYYPGMTVARMAWPDKPLTPLEALPASVGAARPKPTPAPTPAPLPALKEGERYAMVTATSLNVRERPTTASRVVDALDQGRRLIVTGEADPEGWVAMHTAEISGYVKQEYLEME